MMILHAAPANADSLIIEVTLQAKLCEWKELRAAILALKENHQMTIDGDLGGTKEPFWTLIYRLGEMIAKVEKQHSDYR